MELADSLLYRATQIRPLHLTVRLVHETSCFAALPLFLHNKFEQQGLIPFLPLPLELTPVDCMHAPWLLAWGGGASMGPDLEVPSAYASCNGLADGQVVAVKALHSIPDATTVEVEPAEVDDWEMIEVHAEYMEAQVRNQIGVVHTGQLLPFWIHNRHQLRMRVVKAAPSERVRLGPTSELAVLPRPRALRACTSRCSHPPCMLRVQGLHADIKASKHQAKGGTAGKEGCSTACVYLSPATAQWAGVKPGCLLELRTQPPRHTRAPKGDASSKQAPGAAVACVLLSELAAPGHVMTPLTVRRQLAVAEFHQVRAQAMDCEASDLPDPPACIILRKVLVPSQDQNKYAATQGGRSSGSTPLPSISASKVLSDWLAMHVAQVDVGCAQTSAAVQYASSPTTAMASDTSCVSSRVAGVETNGACIATTRVPIFSGMLVHVPSALEATGTTVFQLLCEGPHSQRQRDSSRPTSITLPQTSHLLSLVSIALCHIIQEPDSSRPSLCGERQQASEHPIPSVSVQWDLVGPTFLPKKIDIAYPVPRGCPLDHLVWLAGPAQSALSRLKVAVGASERAQLRWRRCPLPGSVILHGSQGCGKTSLALALVRWLRVSPDYLAGAVLIRGHDIAGRPPKEAKQQLIRAIKAALLLEPAVVVLDDIDALMPAQAEGAEPGGSSPASSALADYLGEQLDKQSMSSNDPSPPRLAFLATCSTPENVDAALRLVGRFDLEIQLEGPREAHRAEMLRRAASSRGLVCSREVCLAAARSTDGFDASDMAVLVERAVHNAAGRLISQGVSCLGLVSATSGREESEHLEGLHLQHDDFAAAREGMVPAAFFGVSGASQAPSHRGVTSRGWADVGGLTDARNSLREVLELPAQHPQIFADAPLRMQFGVLLFGPPGCGKTHIVACAAAACKMRFIAVKGPELLNKYIGQSEAAVRDAFKRASQARPCLLFFDEFDAIAPKRGHDNTGVTDRVVNQLLTELDGVEELVGVTVVAATSRPDLIDAALLRPGRLDRLVFCGFPSAKDRLDVLQVLSRGMHLHDDATAAFEPLAEDTEGFSPADLQALLADAQLAAVHAALEAGSLEHTNLETEQGSPALPLVLQAHLWDAFRGAKRSVTQRERVRLEAIYQEFLFARNPGRESQSRQQTGKRSTLA